MAHRRDQKVTHVGTAHRTDADANLLALRHNLLLPANGVSLAFTTQEFLTPAQFLVLVLAHFLPAFFQHARHAINLLEGRV
jgi:hypothetical protein